MLSISRVVPLLSLTGVVLNALGGLYLAYDLLGGKHGPLRMLSRVLTYSAIFGFGYAAMLGLWFGLAGAFVMGPLIEYQLRRRAHGIEPSNIEWISMAVMRGLSLGIAGWLTVGRHFGIAFGVLSTIGMNIAYEFGLGTNTYRSYQKPRLDRRLALVGIVRGILIGLAGAISGAITRRPQAFLHGIQIGIVVGTLNTAITILSPPVEWWADTLPDRALGGYGAFLVLIGSALQTVQYILPMISR